MTTRRIRRSGGYGAAVGGARRRQPAPRRPADGCGAGGSSQPARPRRQSGRGAAAAPRRRTDRPHQAPPHPHHHRRGAPPTGPRSPGPSTAASCARRTRAYAADRTPLQHPLRRPAPRRHRLRHRRPADIRACLDFARRTATPLAIRSGGHSYAGWSSGNGRLVIDVSKLDSIRARRHHRHRRRRRPAHRRLRTLGRQGRTIPAGSCPTVGVSGLTLGGGHGVLSRSMGLTCDNLIGATIVTADGRTREVSADAEPDLFWALRGAGNGNFGVVTSLRFSTHPVPDGRHRLPDLALVPRRRRGPRLAELGPRPARRHLVRAAPGLRARRLPHRRPSRCSPPVRTAISAAAADRLAAAVGAAAPPRSRCTRTPTSTRPSPTRAAPVPTAAQCHLAPAGRPAPRDVHRPLRLLRHATCPPPASTPCSPRSAPRRALRRRRRAASPSPRSAAPSTAPPPPSTAFSPPRAPASSPSTSPPTPCPRTSWLDTTHAAMRRYASGAAYQNYTDPTLTDLAHRLLRPQRPPPRHPQVPLDPDRLFDFPQAL